VSARRSLFLSTYIGVVAALLGTATWHAARHGYSLVDGPRFMWSLAYFGLLCLAAYAAGIPDAPRTQSPILSATVAATSAALGISLLQLVVGSQLMPRFVVFGTAALLVVFWSYLGYRYRRVADIAGGDRVVYVGADTEAEAFEADLGRAPERAARLVAHVESDELRPLVPNEQRLVDLAHDKDATVVVLGRRALEDRDVVAQASMLHESGIRIRSTTDFYDEWLAKLPAFELQRMSLMFDIQELHDAGYVRVKRLIDVAVSLLGCIALLIAIPFVLVGNVVANRGPLFFRQMRVGRQGSAFEIVKFRTMRAGSSTEWTQTSDPRVTPFGRLLRRTHLDELPQFLNVLVGDLSVVGPRPEQPRYVEQLVECLPFYRLRHLVRPGLTGWAQVKYGYGANEDDALQKLQYDFYYLQHQSVALDLRCIARTVRSVVGSRGR
jgi:exopolysaccharide biosynthesis polyprenyl glycosylphosphotransferase